VEKPVRLDQIAELQSKCADRTRENWRRLRIGLTNALSDDNRTNVGDTLAEYFLAHDPREDSVLRHFDKRLTERERHLVAEALTCYMEVARRLARPTLETLGLDSISSTASNSDAVKAAAANANNILLGWLPMGLPDASTDHEAFEISPLQNHGANDDLIRPKMRSRILAALTEKTRTQVLKFLSAFLMSVEADESALGEAIDAILTPAERDEIIAAYTKFVSEQTEHDVRLDSNAAAFSVGVLLWQVLYWSV
jgi:hypothetical protein